MLYSSINLDRYAQMVIAADLRNSLIGKPLKSARSDNQHFRRDVNLDLQHLYGRIIMILARLEKHLTSEQYIGLLALAEKEKISVDEVIAEAIDFYLSNKDNLLTPEGFDQLLESSREDVEKRGIQEMDIDRIIAEVRYEKAMKGEFRDAAQKT